jgi:hypothetical protein
MEMKVRSKGWPEEGVKATSKQASELGPKAVPHFKRKEKKNKSDEQTRKTKDKGKESSGDASNELAEDNLAFYVNAVVIKQRKRRHTAVECSTEKRECYCDG